MRLPANENSTRLGDPLALVFRGFTKLYSLWVSATYPFAGRGKRLSVHPRSELHRRTAHLIKLGHEVEFHENVWLNVAASLPGARDAIIVIDDRCTIARGSIISAKNHIHFESDVLFGPAALVMDHGHAYEDVTRPIRFQGITEGGTIRIGQGCWIGYGAAIVCAQGELTLGKNCVVAANALVTRSFPAYSVISGNPARIVRQYDPGAGVWILGSIRNAVTGSNRQEQDTANIGQPK